MCRFLWGHTFLIHIGKYQWMWLRVHVVRVCLVRNCQTVLQTGCSIFSIPPVVNESSCCSTSSSEFLVISILDFNHFNRCVVYLIFDMHIWLVIASYAMLRIILRHIIDLRKHVYNQRAMSSCPTVFFFPLYRIGCVWGVR